MATHQQRMGTGSVIPVAHRDSRVPRPSAERSSDLLSHQIVSQPEIRFGADAAGLSRADLKS